MGFLKNLRSKSRMKGERSPPSSPYRSPNYARGGRDFTTRLPEKVLANIFSYVCPHTQDYTYESCESSQIGDGCMLCDLRDLAHCAQACRKWYAVGQQQLYTSVRIDAVHYCELEEVLAEKRRKAAKHFRSKSAVEPVDIPNIRLGLLCRTVREQPNLAAQTLFLKIPYMARETAKADLARTISVLPNLRYVDLPDGFYTGDPSCLPLRQELQVRCPDLRKMSYRSGSEDALELLAHRHWQAIEILDLTNLALEPTTLRIVLASLPALHDLTLSDMDWMDDSIFHPSTGQLPDFPPLQTLTLKDTPNITGQGLTSWLNATHVRESLFSLTLEYTGISMQDLGSVLWAASSIRHLAIIETVNKSLSLATAQMPPLTSISLKTLHFEISGSEDAHGLQKPAESYYAYLAHSLHQNSLPALSTLYVRDPNFSDLLILPPTMPAFGSSEGGSLNSKMSNLSFASTYNNPAPRAAGGGFNQTLEVFSKGMDELEWVFTSIAPPTAGRDRSASVTGGRPLSAYSASRGLGPQWAQGGFGGEARKSVIVGNGFGGFLAVPQEEVPRPTTADGSPGGRWGSTSSGGTNGTTMSHFLKPPPGMGKITSSHERRASKQDLWR